MEKQPAHKISSKWPFHFKALLAGAIVLHIIVFWNIRTDGQKLVDTPTDSPFMQYLGHSIENTDTLLSEQSVIFDSEPLFLPTKWNYSATPDIDIALQEARSFFEPYSPIPLLDAEQPSTFLATIQTDKAKPSTTEAADLLKFDFPHFPKGFGNKSNAKRKLHPTIVMQIEDMQTGRVIYQKTFDGDNATQLTESMWRGNTFLLSADATGLSNPMPAYGGDNENTDSEPINKLMTVIRRIGLSRGYYRISITP